MRTVLLLLVLLLVCSFAHADSNKIVNPDVGVYYYPWWGMDQWHEWQEDHLRDYLVPGQVPELGWYNNRADSVIDQHIQWSEDYDISVWVCSWWGPSSWEAIALNNYIIPKLEGSDVKYCIHYESAGLLGLVNDWIDFSPTVSQTFINHFRTLANVYFSDSSYYRIDGRPVVVVYLTRTWVGNYWDAIAAMREAVASIGYDVYLIADEVYWRGPNSYKIAYFDAITAYNMHGPSSYAGYPQDSHFLQAVQSMYSQYRTVAEGLGVGFVPNVMPGFNDRGVRAGHYIIPRKVHPDSGFMSTYEQMADMALEELDPSTNLVLVTSFNEWHEDTQIEPVAVQDSTNQDISGSQAYTDGYYYRGYGLSFLEATRDKFNPHTACCTGSTGNVDGDPGDMCDIGDLTAFINYLFVTYEAPSCLGEADANGDSVVDMGDLTALIGYLFIPPFTPPVSCQ